MGEQRAIACDRPRPKGRLDVGEPAVQVLVDGEFGRVEREPVAAAGECVGEGGLGLASGGVAAQGFEPAPPVGAAE
jgi:hypothetical protein